MATGALARIGRWGFPHRWTVTATWLVLAVAGVLASESLAGLLSDNKIPHDVESVAAQDLLASASGVHGEVVGLVDRVDPDAAAVRQGGHRRDRGAHRPIRRSRCTKPLRG